MSEPRSFLARWSQRKQSATSAKAAVQPAGAPPAAAEAATEPPVCQPGAPELPLEPAASPELPGLISEEELAALPRIEELTAETDMTVFLRPGVPEATRNAALRRAWMLDAKIREFVSEAREYAYDWNVPGDVPGYGPLPPGLDIKAIAERLFKARSPVPRQEQTAAVSSPATVAPATVAPATEDARSAGIAPAGESLAEAADSRPSSGVGKAEGVANAGVAGDAAPEARTAAAEFSGRRRHGGATPV